jgi:hypothetical protein
VASDWPANIVVMILTYRYRLLPTKAQHCALEAILEGQRQLYNAALEERIGGSIFIGRCRRTRRFALACFAGT